MTAPWEGKGMTVYLVSGGFDPLHSGHIDLLSVGSNIVVGLNSDEWIDRKRKGTTLGCHFMPFEERKAVLEAMGTVSKVIPFDDSSGHAADFLGKARELFGLSVPLVFVNGGDRTRVQDLPKEERETLDRMLIFPKFLETEKANASSDILGDYLNRRGERQDHELAPYSA